MAEQAKTGTREWSEHSRNIATGCAHGCLYCYARTMALRFGRIENGADWTNERVNAKAVTKGYRKVSGTVMFPTTHDITRQTLGPCVQVLAKLLKAGNRVLIVSKPDPAIFSVVRSELEQFKAQVMFRFSIGTLDADTAAFWEPGAPTPEARVQALTDAYAERWETSVSMEPLLSPWDVDAMIGDLADGVSDQIWIGKANMLRRRCAWCIDRPGVAAEIERLERWQDAEHVLAIYNRHKDNPKIAWKDSYTEVLTRHGVEVPHA